MSSPLNINLLIPFKDNKGKRLDLYRKELGSFKEALSKRVEEFKAELVQVFGRDFQLTITARSDGHAKKFYWRFTSSSRDRKYNRLHAESIVDYLDTCHPDRKAWLKELEEELIYINANLKLVKGMLDAIDQSLVELASLRSAQL